MILEYHRPQQLDEALDLLSRNALTIPMGGGTQLTRPGKGDCEVVDLQALGLNQIEIRGNLLALGATVTLQALLDSPQTPPALAKAIEIEASYNLRQAATVAGTLVSADGRSAFATALLAMDARLFWLPGEREVSLGDYFPLRQEKRFGKLISRVILPAQVNLAFESVARSPYDLPVVCVAVACWPSGRTRVAVGGFGKAPLLAMDGSESAGADEAARNVASQAGDEWASAEYRREVVGVLTRRCLAV